MTLLQRNALLVFASHTTIITCIFLVISVLFDYSVAFAWFSISFLLCLIVHTQLWFSLKFNHSPKNTKLYSSLGLANHLTITRALLLCLIAGIYPIVDELINLTPSLVGYLAGITYIVSSCLDGIDGYVARKQGLVTLLGKRLDTQIDALGILIASILAIKLGRVPEIYILTGLVYYLFKAGRWFRKICGKTLAPLQFRPFARTIAGVQMGFLGTALLPILPNYPIRIASIIFMTPLLLGFFWDWLVVNGISKKKESLLLHHFTQKSIILIQINSRLLVSMMGIPIMLSHFSAGSHLLMSWIGLVIMICVGLCGRLAALTAAILLSFAFPEHNPSPLLLIVFCALLLIFLFGTGPYSIYSPEEFLFKYESKSISTPQELD